MTITEWSNTVCHAWLATRCTARECDRVHVLPEGFTRAQACGFMGITSGAADPVATLIESRAAQLSRSLLDRSNAPLAAVFGARYREFDLPAAHVVAIHYSRLEVQWLSKATDLFESLCHTKTQMVLFMLERINTLERARVRAVRFCAKATCKFAAVNRTELHQHHAQRHDGFNPAKVLPNIGNSCALTAVVGFIGPLVPDAIEYGCLADAVHRPNVHCATLLRDALEFEERTPVSVQEVFLAIRQNFEPIREATSSPAYYELMCQNTACLHQQDHYDAERPLIPIFGRLQPTRTAGGVNLDDADICTNTSTVHFTMACPRCQQVAQCRMRPVTFAGGNAALGIGPQEEANIENRNIIFMEFQPTVQPADKMLPIFELDNALWQSDAMIIVERPAAGDPHGLGHASWWSWDGSQWSESGGLVTRFPQDSYVVMVRAHKVGSLPHAARTAAPFNATAATNGFPEVARIDVGRGGPTELLADAADPSRRRHATRADLYVGGLNICSLTEEKAVAFTACPTVQNLSVVTLQELNRPTPLALATCRDAGFDVFCRLRDGIQGGGVALLSRVPSMPVSAAELAPPAHPEIEYIARRIDGPAGDIIIVSVYCPPSNSLDSPTGFDDALARWIDSMPENVLVIGDTNARHPHWCPGAAASASLTIAQARGARLAGANKRTLAHNTPTRLESNSSPDTTTVGRELLTTALHVHKLPLRTDHSMQCVRVSTSHVPFENRRKADWTTDWHEILPDHLRTFKSVLSAALTAAPLPPLNTEEDLRVAHDRLVKEILTAQKHCLPIRSGSDYSQARSQHNWVHREFERAMERASSAEERKAVTEHFVWSSLRHFRQRAANYTPEALFRLFNTAPRHTTLPRNAPSRERFEEYYSTCLNEPATRPADHPARPPLTPPGERVDVPRVSLDEARFGCRHNVKGARDPDGISPRVLRILPDTALQYIADLGTASFTLGVTAPQWRHSVVTPLDKQKAPTEPKGYRPVAMTSLIGRSIERIALMRMVSTLEQHLHTDQHGFRKNRSVDSALRIVIDTARSMLDTDTRVHIPQAQRNPNRHDATKSTHCKSVITAVDLSDAFTRVSHNSVLSNLSRLQVDPAIIRWVAGWLSGRTFALRLRDDIGASLPVTRGVPQGSILGPILFIVVADSLLCALDDAKPRIKLSVTELFRLRVVMYADDLTIIISSPNIDHAIKGSKHWLRVVSDWARREGIPISSKSESIIIHKSREVASSKTIVEQFSDDGAPLCAGVEPIRVLGIMIQRNLEPTAHRAKLLPRIDHVLTVMHAVKFYTSCHTVRAIYTSYGLSALMFGAMHYGTKGLRDWETRHASACRAITNTAMSSPSEPVFREAGFRSLEAEIEIRAIYDKARCDGALNPASANLQPIPAHLPYDVASIDSSKIHFHLLERGREAGPDGTDEKKRRLNDERLLRVAERLRAVHGLPAGTAPLVLATDGSAARNETQRPSGAGVITDGRDSGCQVLREIRSFPSELACSYSAEGSAAIAGVRALLDMAKSEPQPPAAVEWVVDSLSIASALAKGPIRQSCYFGCTLWRLLLELSTLSHVYIIFVYSHVGVHVNELADQLADQFAQRTPNDAAHPYEQVWWRDYARNLANPVKCSYDDAAAGLDGAASIRGEFGPKAPRFIGLFPTTRAAHTDLARLRVGLNLRIGPLAHGDTLPCPRCGAAVMGRQGTAVRHLFTCPSAAALRQEHGIPAAEGLRSLWTRPAHALQYFYAFIDRFGGPTQ